MDPSSKDSYDFPCMRWLAKGEDDGQIERVLNVVGGDRMADSTVMYTISVVTSDVKGAGTDANVWCQFFGAQDDTGVIRLTRSETFKDKFERGHTDIFKIESVDIGDLSRMKIGHDGKGIGAGWKLDSVIVHIQSVGKKYKFRCDRWLATDEDDGLLEREILLDPDDVIEVGTEAVYECRVKTSDIRGAGTDAKVYLVLYGTNSKTDEIHLSNHTDNFERGQLDVFRLEFPDVGPIHKARIWHNNAGIGAAWHLGQSSKGLFHQLLPFTLCKLCD